MAIVKAQLVAGGRQIKKTFTGHYFRGRAVGEISGAIKYEALSDTPYESPLAVLSSALLPQVGDMYVEGGIVFPNVFFKEASPQYVGPFGNCWKWAIDYTLGGDDQEEQEEDGDEVITNFSISVDREEYATAFDLDNQANCNSLGEMFADPLIIQNAIVNFNFQRKEYANPIPRMNRFFNTHNGTTFWDFPPGTWKVAEMTANATEKQSGTEWETSYKLQYRRRGWAIEKANTGFYYNAGTSITRALNEDGSPVDEPIILNADGTKWTGGVVPCKYFRVTYPEDFYALNLPNPFLL